MLKNLYVIVFFATALFIISCNDDKKDSSVQKSRLASTYDAYLSGEWIKLYLDIEKDLPGFRPSATSRALGYIHMAAYQAAIPGMPRHKNLSDIIPATNLPAFTDTENEYHWPSAVNAAYRTTHTHFMINTIAGHQELIQQTFDKWNTQFENELDKEVVARSVAWGNQVANAIIAYAQTDGAAEEQVVDAFPISYVPPVGPGLWVATDGPALFPYWGQARTFGTFNFDGLLLDPLPYSTDPNSAYYKEGLEVNNTVANLGNKDRWIAEFWSDDIVGLTFSPPARQFAIVEQLYHQEEMTLDKALFLSVKLGMSINDASVLAWYSKYKYNVIRPENYIRDVINPDFRTILGEAIGRYDISPAFPAYPSGHSTFASAAAGIFIDELGEGYAFTDRCHEDRTEFAGTPRSYVSWRKMAEENAFSRIPLGVHFRMDCVEGLRLGYIVADNINKLFE